MVYGMAIFFINPTLVHYKPPCHIPSNGMGYNMETRHIQDRLADRSEEYSEKKQDATLDTYHPKRVEC